MPDVPDLALAEELRKRGIHPSRRLGQNFMVDRKMLDLIAETARVGTCDLVLEIGTGTGFLTQRLCAAARQVVSVEVDSRLYDLSCERLGALDNLTLVHSDALAGEHAFAPAVIDALRQALRGQSGPATLKLVSNLPYAIATAVAQAVTQSDLPFEGLWITVQKEVAERLVARPGTDQYGFVSVILALVADIRIVRSIGPQVFWPRPKVDSALVEVLLRREGRPSAADAARLRALVSRLFSARRKELAAALKLAGLNRQDIVRAGQALVPFGLDLHERVGKLPPAVLVALAGTVNVTPAHKGG